MFRRKKLYKGVLRLLPGSPYVTLGEWVVFLKVYVLGFVYIVLVESSTFCLTSGIGVTDSIPHSTSILS